MFSLFSKEKCFLSSQWKSWSWYLWRNWVKNLEANNEDVFGNSNRSLFASKTAHAAKLGLRQELPKHKGTLRSTIHWSLDLHGLITSLSSKNVCKKDRINIFWEQLWKKSHSRLLLKFTEVQYFAIKMKICHKFWSNRNEKKMWSKHSKKSRTTF